MYELLDGWLLLSTRFFLCMVSVAVYLFLPYFWFSFDFVLNFFVTGEKGKHLEIKEFWVVLCGVCNFW